MIERIEYWKGFTGGLIAGIAIGAWIYFSPRVKQQILDLDRLDGKRTDELPQRRQPMKEADPAALSSSLVESAMGPAASGVSVQAIPAPGPISN